MRSSIVIAMIAAICAVTAPAALADATNSSNWAGYAVHKPGVSFHTVSGTWRQPDAKCTPGVETYSAFWVGLGGFSLNAPALEQTGTEVDCSISGKVVSSAWYELVPAASTTIRLTVRPGDLMRARVTLTGRQVVISLDDLTRHTGFKKTLNANVIDVSSAEWIAEAPSQCVSLDACQTLPLADFAPTKFDSATARASTGHSGSISDRMWGWTKINHRTWHFVGIFGAIFLLCMLRGNHVGHVEDIFLIIFALLTFFVVGRDMLGRKRGWLRQ